ncbi:MAG: NUDIX domain-containing protein [Rhodospirillales bacterium]|nr:NUDIX domain-containing protein [Rhodospirillales bacterium]
MARVVSCGVIVTDGARVLLGHATRTPRWDIPKGLTEADEDPLAAALRELAEETGLVAPPPALQPLGRHRYLPAKDLVLFTWVRPDLPDPAALRCRTRFRAPDGAMLPEFDRFGVFAWDEALQRVNRSMAQVLREQVIPRLPLVPRSGDEGRG